MVSPTQPLVLVFDLDETLFSTQVNENEPPVSLSQSAQNVLSVSGTGIADKPVLITIEDQDYTAHAVTAINREKIKGIFDQIYLIMQRANDLHMDSPIAVKIITAGTYDEQHIKRLFDQFYGDNSDLFSSGRFPIEYFNRSDLGEYPKEYAPTGRETNKGIIDPRKAVLIKEKYPEWKKEMQGLVKNRIYLIDNLDENVQAVETLGFKALHYPTTPEDRIEGRTFTEKGAKTLQKITKLVEEIDKSFRKKFF